MSCLAAGVKGEKLNDKMTDRIPKVNKLHNTNKEDFYPMPMYMCFTLCPCICVLPYAHVYVFYPMPMSM